jgi:hypothetical protein
MAAALPDERDQSRVVHSRLEQIAQRVFMIACGYEDCNDADSLRHDPLFKTVCGGSPSRSGETPVKILGDSTGVLQAPCVRKVVG